MSPTSSLPDLSNLERRGHITFVPLGGGDLLGWTYRLAGVMRAECHIYDREDSPATELRYQVAKIVNQRPNCRAFVTSKRSLENYLDARAVFAASGIQVAFGDDDDVADLVAERQYLARHPLCCWPEAAAAQPAPAAKPSQELAQFIGRQFDVGPAIRRARPGGRNPPVAYGHCAS